MLLYTKIILTEVKGGIFHTSLPGPKAEHEEAEDTHVYKIAPLQGPFMGRQKTKTYPCPILCLLLQFLFSNEPLENLNDNH